MRVGVLGLRRGHTLAREAVAAGMSVVAVCDLDEQRAQSASAEFEATPYPDVEAFLRHPMDGVIVANAFDEHAPIAIKALESGLHVLSETTACRSLAEAVSLVRTVERTGLVYCFGENYPYKPHARLMRRLFQDGAIGTVQYAECEYLHGFSPDWIAHLGEKPGHWRLRISSLAYGTHSIAPVMYVTDTRPTEVSSFVIPRQNVSVGRFGHGLASVSIVRLDNDAYLKSLHGFLQGEQQPENSWLRIHGSDGLLENLRVGDSRHVRLRQEDWATASGQTDDQVIVPSTEPSDDRLVCESFRDAVETGQPPYFDVYRGVAASLVSICGMRSLLSGSQPVRIPDMRDETARRHFASDTWNGLE